MQQLLGKHRVGIGFGARLSSRGFSVDLEALELRRSCEDASGLRKVLRRRREITMTNKHATFPLSPCHAYFRRENPANCATPLVFSSRRRQQQQQQCQ